MKTGGDLSDASVLSFGAHQRSDHGPCLYSIISFNKVFQFSVKIKNSISEMPHSFFFLIIFWH